MSDRNSKTNINPVFNALEQVKYLNPVTYDWNNQNKSRWKNNQNQKQNQHDIGFITQDVEQVLPGIVAEDEEGNKLLNYTAIIPILTKAIKELNDKVDELEKKVSDLSSKGDNSNKLKSSVEINISGKHNGIYFLKIVVGKQQSEWKIVKK